MEEGLQFDVPRELLERQSVRRGSVFSDLLTIFRRSTVYGQHRLYHARRPSDKDQKVGFLLESEAFLNEAGAGPGHEDDEEEGKPMTRQVLLDKIRQKKEVIGKLRCQPWSMNRKRRTLRLAQKYLERHESRVSKTHLYKEEFKKRWRATCRWVDNIKIYLIPWEAKIKRIESHFGSVVSSYFTFLRWVVFVNLIITLIILSFVVIPEVVTDAAASEERRNKTESRKTIPVKERETADQLQVVWHFKGYLEYSPLFYGYYSDDSLIEGAVPYEVPLAYFLITLFIFAYSFFAILRKMAANARQSKLSGSKTEQYVFNWRVFTGWDYTIGNPDTASNTVMAAVIKLRESIAECKVEDTGKFRPLLLLARIFANAVILGMLAFSIYCIAYAVLQPSAAVEKTGLLTKNHVPTIVATITHVFPMIFDLIGKMERYHPRTALRAHLTRVLVLYVLNYLTLIIALFESLGGTADVASNMTSIEKETRMKRQMDSWNPTFPRLESKNFSDVSQGRKFFKDAFERFSKLQTTTPFSIGVPLTTRRRRRTTKGTLRTLPSGDLTIQHQFGPVGLNNPNAWLTNDTFEDGGRLFETVKVGPSRMPTFAPAPTPSKSPLPTTVRFQVGPRWRNRTRKKPKSDSKPTNLPSQDARMEVTTTSSYKLSQHPQVTTTSTSTSPEPAMLTTTANIFMHKPTDKIIRPTVPLKPKVKTQPTKSEILSKLENVTRENLAEEETKMNRTPYEERSKANSRETDRKNDTDLKTDSAGRHKTAAVATDALLENNDTQLAENDSLYEIGETAPMKTEQDKTDCWETKIGQEIVKLVTMDLIITIASIMLIDFFRGLWIKYCSAWWCWDIETIFPEYGEFKVAENVLHIINNQGMIWLGLFFAPMLPVINNVKLIILMYIRGWACMTCNVPAREIFRASRSSNFYLTILLLWLLLCTLPVGYVIANKKPSTACGPFAGKENFYNVVTMMLKDEKIKSWLTVIASPGVIIPVLLLLLLIIYFLVSLVRGLREANTDLQQQLIHERTEEKKKIFELAGGGHKTKFHGPERGDKKKKVVTYLPLVEQKRREPWRAYNGLENDSLYVTDETSTMTTPTSNAAWPLVPVKTKYLPSRPQCKESPTVPHDYSALYDSQKSLDETEDSVDATASQDDRRIIPISKSVSQTKSAVTDRADDWYNEEMSDHSYDVSSGVVELATPEEIRNLIRPLTDSLYSSAVSLAGFPKETDSSPVTVVFPSSNTGAAGSRRSSKRFSYISLYENPMDEMPVSKIVRSATALPYEENTGAFGMHESMIISHPVTVQRQPSVHRILDPRSVSEGDEGVSDKSDETVAPDETTPPPISPQQEKKKIEPKATISEFQPWPSIEEVRQRRTRLQKLPMTEVPLTSSWSPRRRSPPMKTIEGSPVKEEGTTTASNQRRFRISVSPTRRLQQTDPSGSDTDTSTGKKRYLIKQVVIPGSMASVEIPPAETRSKEHLSSSYAPHVEFGDDDSPRVHDVPTALQNK